MLGVFLLWKLVEYALIERKIKISDYFSYLLGFNENCLFSLIVVCRAPAGFASPVNSSNSCQSQQIDIWLKETWTIGEVILAYL